MSIIFNQDSKTFHLTNKKTSYIFKILDNGNLVHLYYGPSLPNKDNFDYLFRKKFSGHLVTREDDLQFSFDYLKSEYPTFGQTDYREGAYQVKNKNGSKVSELKYVSHEIFKGKNQLLNGLLPATYVENDNEATSLNLLMRDEVLGMDVVLKYTIYEEINAITRSVYFSNNSEETINLERALSMSLDLDGYDYEMINLNGAWARERQMEVSKLHHGDQSIFSTRGDSSTEFNPFICLKKPMATETTGDVLGFSLIYSSNFLGSVNVNLYNKTRVMMGINPFTFKWNLNPGDSFQTPEAVMVYSQEGLNGMSQTFHELYRKRLARGEYRDADRPVLLNNWEGTYFDFNEEKILSMATDAKELGAELFVLDDGWFGKRNDDKSSLGDWFVNYDKLENGIKGLSNKIEAMGLKFGLWFEPEMVSPISELFEVHPDWIVGVTDRVLSIDRYQYVLDFTRTEVVDYIFNMMSSIISESKISYIKWDLNRSISEAYSTKLATDQQGEFYHRYILGVYDLYNRLTTKYPQVLFESCASGGLRFDPAMLYYAPQTWTSDDTDTVERLKIQYGTSLVYPLSSMGAHVSAVPNHQVYRITPLETRANTAFFGVLGYELDPTKLTDDEKMRIKKQIQLYKEHREVFQYGTFYRLVSPYDGDGNITSWMCVSENKETAIMGIYQVLSRPNPNELIVKLAGLNDEFEYTISNRNYTLSGRELKSAGLPFHLTINNEIDVKTMMYSVLNNMEYTPVLGIGDYSSELIILRREK